MTQEHITAPFNNSFLLPLVRTLSNHDGHDGDGKDNVSTRYA